MNDEATNCMLQMFYDMKACEQIAERTWRLISFPRTYTKLPCVGHSFRIILPDNKMVKAVSCSIPIDVNRGISARMRNFDLNISYETALVGHDDDLIYINDLGYDDVKRFDLSTQVVEEVMRVMDNIQELEEAKKKST